MHANTCHLFFIFNIFLIINVLQAISSDRNMLEAELFLGVRIARTHFSDAQLTN